MAPLTALFQPITIGTLRLANRITMSAMNDNMSNPDGSPTEHQVDYYEARALGGVGMVVTGNAYIDDESSQIASGQPGLWSDQQVPLWGRFTDRIHLAGTPVLMQLVHAGTQTAFAWKRPLVSPSGIPSAVMQQAARPLTFGDIETLRERFVLTAERARRAGFDGVELHCGHGYLLSSFMSPATNHRTDAYGGSLENRMRFPLETLALMRRRLGPQFVIGVKMNGMEEVADGVTLDMALRHARLFEEAGADYLTVSSGTYESGDEQCLSLYVRRLQKVHLAAAVKGLDLSIPVIAINSIVDPLLAEQIVAEGLADMVALGRPLIADPDLPDKARRGALEEIRLCIRCNDCQGRLVENRQIICAVNPDVGHERAFVPQKAAQSLHVLVVGGGPAGLEAARVSALRGHRVTLIEQNDRIGGTCLPRFNPVFKRELDNIPRYYDTQFARLRVEVRLGQSVSPDEVDHLRPDKVVIAVGGIPVQGTLPTDGSDVAVLTAVQYLNQKPDVGDRIAIIGAGLVGCETALDLAQAGNTVYLLTRRPAGQVASDLNALAQYRLVTEMSQHGVTILDMTYAREISNGHLVVERDGQATQELDVTAVLFAWGFLPNLVLADTLRNRGYEVWTVGDCVRPANIHAAVSDGAAVARRL